MTEFKKLGVPVNRWYRYDKMMRFPQNFFSMGDAVSSVNPIYGQGMTKAAIHAMHLRKLLHTAHSPGWIAERMRKGIPGLIEKQAWMTTVYGDLVYPQAIGARPADFRFVTWYTRCSRGARIDRPRSAQGLSASVYPSGWDLLNVSARHLRKDSCLRSATTVCTAGAAGQHGADAHFGIKPTIARSRMRPVAAVALISKNCPKADAPLASTRSMTTIDEAFGPRPPLTTEAACKLVARSGAIVAILVEGWSDQAALEVLAHRRGLNLAAERIVILPVGGATNTGKFLDALARQG